MRGGLRHPHRGGGLFDTPAADEDCLSVSQLTRRIKSVLTDGIGRVTVTGELSAVKRAPSGHVYLTLKDEGAVLDGILWRSSAAKLRFEPEIGQSVLAKGELTVYEPRGRYQLTIRSLQREGQGNLQAQFEALVRALREEGLFDPKHKQPIPPRPETIGVVTSEGGAALRDIIKVARRRCPGVRIVVSPCVVQGPGAPEAIVRALKAIDRWGGCDVLLVGRGGGSAEDLWAFNTEPVARAIFEAKTPIISAVGHEIDLSIADLVADQRAATPSEAAEAAVPDLREMQNRLVGLQRSLDRALRAPLREARLRLQELLRSPVFRDPRQLILTKRQQLDDTMQDLMRAARDVVTDHQRALALTAAKLEGLSPLAVLARGFSVTRKDKTVLRAATQVSPGDSIETILPDGRAWSTVDRIEPTR